MRFRLFRRRLTVSAPHMTVRNAMAWPLRWAFAAIVLGFCAAISLWAFEFGKGLAGLDTHSREELDRLRAEVVQLRAERDKTQSVVNTAGSLLTAEKAAQEHLAGQIRQLEADNRALRADLGFFEKLIPASTTEAIAIRGLQAEALGAPELSLQMKWQVLVIQPVKNAPEFKGKLDLTFTGTQNGKPWMMSLPGGGQPLQFHQYRRIEGLVDLPPQVVVHTVSARVLEGTVTRAVQTIKLSS
ncbi:MAG: hypothetical protein Q8K38_00895 [Burkholderiaceae bacterium]|nr:hypothetical protein [Burkholderiaceae bacterium]MDZ4146118.1 DUF6776 family protein [Burkholderiales bacterium]